MNLTRKRRKAIALQISRELRNHPDRMRQMSVGEIFRSISSGNASLPFEKVGTTRTGRLAGFAHLVQGKDEFGDVEQDVLEVGAVLTLAEPGNGYAKNAIKEAVKTGQRRGAKKIKALVHTDNEQANGLMTKIAGEPVRTRPSNYVTETDGKPAQMNEYVLWEG